jgi:hypothetical protein
LKNNFFVRYCNFAKEYTSFLNSKYSKEIIQKIKSKYSSLPIWEIYSFFEGGKLFYKTRKEVEEFKNNGTTQLIQKDYFEFLKLNDEYDLLNSNNFYLIADSKQVVDEEYDGNLFYYFK